MEIFNANANINIFTKKKSTSQDWFPFPIIMFSPVVEAEHSDAFLTMWPEQAYQAGLVAAKPLIAGFNENEGQSILLGK